MFFGIWSQHALKYYDLERYIWKFLRVNCHHKEKNNFVCCGIAHLIELILQLGLPCWLSVKNMPAKQEAQVWSLGWEDPLEKEMATHSVILVWGIARTEEPGRLWSMGSQRVGHDLATNFHFFHFILPVEEDVYSHAGSLQLRLFATPWTVNLLCPFPWGAPGKNTGVGCHALLQGIFLTEGSNLHFSSIGRQVLYHWATWEVLLLYSFGFILLPQCES